VQRVIRSVERAGFHGVARYATAPCRDDDRCYARFFPVEERGRAELSVIKHGNTRRYAQYRTSANATAIADTRETVSERAGEGEGEGAKKAQCTELNGNIISFRVADKWKPEKTAGDGELREMAIKQNFIAASQIRFPRVYFSLSLSLSLFFNFFIHCIFVEIAAIRG